MHQSPILEAPHPWARVEERICTRLEGGPPRFPAVNVSRGGIALAYHYRRCAMSSNMEHVPSIPTPIGRLKRAPAGVDKR